MNDERRIAPRICATFSYRGYNYRVVGYLKPAIKPENLDWIGELLFEVAYECGPRKEKLQCCVCEEAMYVMGSGIAGVIAPIEDIVVTGMVNWPEERIKEAEERAARRVGEIII
jgi:hypothetical protein